MPSDTPTRHDEARKALDAGTQADLDRSRTPAERLNAIGLGQFVTSSPSDDEPGFTDEECPAWNHTEDEGFDEYVVCLRCEHYEQDCPHECGPEFSFDDVADALEWRYKRIIELQAQLARHVDIINELNVTISEKNALFGLAAQGRINTQRRDDE